MEYYPHLINHTNYSIIISKTQVKTKIKPDNDSVKQTLLSPIIIINSIQTLSKFKISLL